MTKGTKWPSERLNFEDPITGVNVTRWTSHHAHNFHQSVQLPKIHVHPRFSPNGKQVLFTSDMSGYGDLYMVDVPPFESLPTIENGKLIR